MLIAGAGDLRRKSFTAPVIHNCELLSVELALHAADNSGREHKFDEVTEQSSTGVKKAPPARATIYGDSPVPRHFGASHGIHGGSPELRLQC